MFCIVCLNRETDEFIKHARKIVLGGHEETSAKVLKIYNAVAKWCSKGILNVSSRHHRNEERERKRRVVSPPVFALPLASWQPPKDKVYVDSINTLYATTRGRFLHLAIHLPADRRRDRGARASRRSENACPRRVHHVMCEISRSSKEEETIFAPMTSRRCDARHSREGSLPRGENNTWKDPEVPKCLWKFHDCGGFYLSRGFRNVVALWLSWWKMNCKSGDRGDGFWNFCVSCFDCGNNQGSTQVLYLPGVFLISRNDRNREDWRAVLDEFQSSFVWEDVYSHKHSLFPRNKLHIPHKKYLPFSFESSSFLSAKLRLRPASQNSWISNGRHSWPKRAHVGQIYNLKVAKQLSLLMKTITVPERSSRPSRLNMCLK